MDNKRNLTLLAERVGYVNPTRKQLSQLFFDVMSLEGKRHQAFVLRYGLQDGVMRSEAQVAKELGVSRQCASAYEKTGVRALQKRATNRDVDLGEVKKLRVNKHKIRTVGENIEVIWEE